MGFIHSARGKVSIETRRESFIIHAGYGVKTGTSKVGDLSPATEFVVADPRLEPRETRRWKVFGVFADHVDATESVSGVHVSFPLGTVVEIPGTEVADPDDPLGSLWEGPHPEFRLEDLDDLIYALQDVREREREAVA